MYEVLAGNRVRKIPEMRTQEVMGVFEDYEEKLAKAPTYEISGSHNWKEGQLIEEGKDFEIVDRSINGGKTGEGIVNDYVAWPFSPVTNEEDELWSYVIEFIFLSDLSSEEKRERLKQHF